MIFLLCEPGWYVHNLGVQNKSDTHMYVIHTLRGKTCPRAAHQACSSARVPKALPPLLALTGSPRTAALEVSPPAAPCAPTPMDSVGGVILVGEVALWALQIPRSIISSIITCEGKQRCRRMAKYHEVSLRDRRDRKCTQNVYKNVSGGCCMLCTRAFSHMVITYSRQWINRVRLPILLVVS